MAARSGSVTTIVNEKLIRSECVVFAQPALSACPLSALIVELNRAAFPCECVSPSPTGGFPVITRSSAADTIVAALTVRERNQWVFTAELLC